MIYDFKILNTDAQTMYIYQIDTFYVNINNEKNNKWMILR